VTLTPKENIKTNMEWATFIHIWSDYTYLPQLEQALRTTMMGFNAPSNFGCLVW